MKKMLLLLLMAIGCAAALPACGSLPAAPLGQSAEESGAGYTLSQQVYQEECWNADRSHLLGKYSFTLPEMTGSGAAAAAADVFNEGVGTMLADEQAHWEGAMQDAKSYYYSMGSASWSSTSAWVMEIQYETVETENLISLRYEHYVYSGGAHGYTYYTYQLFALQEGCFVSLQEMADDPAALQSAVAEEILRQIDAGDLAREYAYWSDYETYVRHWMEDYSVLFCEDGAMEIIFPAYDLASYAAGPQTFRIDRSVYEGCLNDYGKVLLGIPL